MAAKKKIVEKKGMTAGNRQYTSQKSGGMRRTVVWHPDEGAVIKRTVGKFKPSKSTMGTVNGPPASKQPDLKKPARKVDTPYSGGTVRKRR